MMTEERVSAEVGAVKQALRALIKGSDYTERDISLALGYKGSYLSNVWGRSGRRPTVLKLETVLGILHTVGVDPGQFFKAVLAPPGEGIDPRIRELVELSQRRLSHKGPGIDRRTVSAFAEMAVAFFAAVKELSEEGEATWETAAPAGKSR